MPAIFTALCLRPSATDPTPLEVLLKTKARPQFDKTVKRLSKPFFYVFQQSNPTQFQPSFSVLTVRSAEGRKLQKNETQRFPVAEKLRCHPFVTFCSSRSAFRPTCLRDDGLNVHVIIANKVRKPQTKIVATTEQSG